MKEILAQLSQHPVSTRLSLTGTIIVGRDIAHAKLKELIDAGKELPAVHQRSPDLLRGCGQRAPAGYTFQVHLAQPPQVASDSYVDLLQSHGGSMIMLAKGNALVSRSPTRAINTAASTSAVRRRPGGSAGASRDVIKRLECVAYPELGMEAIWKIEVEDFPAFSPGR